MAGTGRGDGFGATGTVGAPAQGELGRWRSVLVIALLGAFVGIGYSFSLALVSGEGRDARDLAIGFETGFLVAGMTSTFEVLVYRAPRGRWLRRQALWLQFPLRLFALFALVVGALLLARQGEFLLEGPAGDPREQGGQFLANLIFSLAVMSVFVLVMQTSALIGGRTLGNLLVGRYNTPRREMRVFAFLDMRDSTAIGGRLSAEQFLEFLADAFFVMDAELVRHGGEVHAYVGDEVIVTWPLGKVEGTDLVPRAIFGALAALEAEAPRFLRQYGVAPRFRAAAHGGAVVVGECGDSHRQITYLGDVVNVTARIEEAAKELGLEVVLSAALLGRIRLPPGLQAQAVGPVALRGVAEPLELVALVASGPGALARGEFAPSAPRAMHGARQGRDRTR